MVQRDPEIRNAARREYVAQQGKKAKSKAKLNRRLAQKKAEKDDPELKRQRLAKNVPRTIEGTREWIGGSSSIALPQQEEGDDHDEESSNSEDDMGSILEDEEDDEEEADDEMQEDVDVTTKSSAPAKQPKDRDQGDARTRPVQIKSGSNPEEFDLDMAGLEDLFPQAEAAAEASTSHLPPPPPHKPFLLTTSPRPHGPTYAFLNELQSLLGGKKYAEIVPRKNARFELSKVCKWATKRGYGGIAVVGEDLHGEPATITISLLPYGPCAHFRLTSVALHKQISNSANPTPHIPELVLSNFSTPLGLSIGRLLQSFFPPLPQIVGRQVVAVHNQRDYIFFRRFRYMFALRETEASKKVAKERGMDEDVRTRMQEIGPRFTLKLRWLKRGPLGEGRRRGPNGETTATHIDIGNEDERERDMTEQEKREAQEAENEMLAQLGQEAQADPEGIVGGQAFTSASAANTDAPRSTTASSATVPVITENETKKRKRSSKKTLNQRPRTTSPGGSVSIPKIKIPTQSSIDKNEHPHMRKLKKGASVLDSLPVTLGLGRGGTKKKNLEWEWDPRMNVSRRKFAL